ncbi:MAG: zinc ribbon domain-containing protein [Gammaproteobacteria bacterium]|nr:zinc ribbon domain-containing protein [Gammaproteobacteria bacterium]
MTDYKFADNYRDLCRSDGVDAGFQFEFRCERCSDTWRTEFKPYRAGQASGWIRQVGYMLGSFGGWGNTAGSAVGGIAQAGFSTARDGAFQEAIASAENHFNRCAKCTQHVCAKCWDGARGLCLLCAPDVKIEIETARREGELQAAHDRAREAGLVLGAKPSVTTEQQLVCPQCSAQTRGAKFCPDCGTTLAAPTTCTKCQAPLLIGAKFCGECGAKA